MKLVPSGLPESVRHHARVLGDARSGLRACGAGSTGIAGWQGTSHGLVSLCR